MKKGKTIRYFIIDFDSTFVQSEGLEELAAVSLKNRIDRNLVIDKIKAITNYLPILLFSINKANYQIKALGAAKHFVAFTENVKQEAIVDKADQVAPNFDDFLFVNQLPRFLSYPKNRIKALLIGDVGKKAFKLFRKEGYTLYTRQVSSLENLKKIHIILANDWTSLNKEFR